MLTCKAQFMLASQISGKVMPPTRGAARSAVLKDQIADRVTKANDPKIKAAGDALTAKLTAVEGEIYQYRNRSGQDPLNFPIKLNNKLAALQGIVESGDYRPTDQSSAVFKDLSRSSRQLVARLADPRGARRVQPAGREEEAGARRRATSDDDPLEHYGESRARFA